MKIPQLLLRQLYTFGSLTNEAGGFRLSLKNRLSDVTITRILRVQLRSPRVSGQGARRWTWATVAGGRPPR